MYITATMAVSRIVCALFIIIKITDQDNIHFDMTESELRATFGFTDAVPDYEIVTVEENRNRQRRESTKDTYKLIINRKEGQLDIQLFHQRDLVRSSVSITSLDERGETTQAFPAPDCIFRGEMDNGIAALSSCDGNGMTGIMITPQDTYVLKPVPTRARKRRSAAFSNTSHILYKTPKAIPSCGSPDNLESLHLRFPRFVSNSQSLGTKTIEIAVVVDNIMYDILSKGKDDPTSAITHHVFTIMNGVHLLYSNPTMSVRFNIVIVKIIILKSGSGGPSKENGDIHNYLRRFSEWQEKKNVGTDNNDPQHWDHALMLSGLDLYMTTPENRVVIGLAWVSGMCHKRYSASLNEGLTMESVYVISHELGHNLGMQHDGDKNECTANTHIMSASLGPGKTSWSSCSNKYLKDFLRTKGARCLNDNAIPSPELDHHKGDLPGERYPADTQCSLAFGEKFTPYNAKDEPFDDFCRELWCYNGTVAKRAHPALYGTNCGEGKICAHGKCVLASSVSDVIYLDEPESNDRTQSRKVSFFDTVKSTFNKFVNAIKNLFS